MIDLKFVLLFVGVSALWGGLWWWVLWSIAGTKAMAESHFGRRVLKGLGLFIGLGLPMMALLAAVLHNSM
jgi:hypothetical protein